MARKSAYHWVYILMHEECVWFFFADNDLTDFNAYLNIMAKKLTTPEADDELRMAFRVFDKEGMYIALFDKLVFVCMRESSFFSQGVGGERVRERFCFATTKTHTDIPHTPWDTH